MGEEVWQPIETAPVDGENILVTDGTVIFLVYCNTSPSEWRDVWCGNSMTAFTPTHWMPLPELPEGR